MIRPRTTAMLALLALAGAAATIHATPARSATTERPAGLDDAGWRSLQAAIEGVIEPPTRLTGDGSGPGADGAVMDNFGGAVAWEGDTAVVGADRDDIGGRMDQGSVTVFVRDGSNWVEQAKLVADDGAPEDRFGSTVALSGDTLLVGAPLDDIGDRPNQGSVYVFVRQGGVWAQQAKLVIAGGAFSGSAMAVAADLALIGTGGNLDTVGYHEFTRTGTAWTQRPARIEGTGRAVALSGDTALVQNYVTGLGLTVDVLVRNGGGWERQARLQGDDTLPSDGFGDTIAISGNVLVVGAPKDTIDGAEYRGSAYVFERSGTTWTQKAKLFAPDGEAYEEFGQSIAVSGVTVVAGVPFRDNVGATYAGRIHVFERDGAQWSHRTTLERSDGSGGDGLGNALAMSGDSVLAGAFGDNVQANGEQGSAHFFVRTAGVWSQGAQLDSGAGAAWDFFGLAVAVSGDTALVSVDAGNVDGSADAGAVHVFVRSGTAWMLQARLRADSGVPRDGFGRAVALSGDTALIGAERDDVGGNADQGSAYVFTRNGGVWTLQDKLVATDGAAADRFGWAVALSGDTALVGAYGHDVGPSIDQGSAYVFVRNGSAWQQQTKLVGADGAAGDRAGAAVALSGDTALVAGLPVVPPPAYGTGFVQAFVRNGTTWTRQATLRSVPGATDDGFGLAVALHGDDALVGAPGADVGGQTNQGAVHWFTRVGATWSRRATWLAPDGQAGDEFGRSVALSTGAALIGAWFDDIGANPDQGSAYLYTRCGSGWAQHAPWTTTVGAPAQWFGGQVALSDTTALIGITGAHGAGPYGNPAEGAAEVYTGVDALVAECLQLDGFESGPSPEPGVPPAQ